jgi:hypothetical protein
MGYSLDQERKNMNLDFKRQKTNTSKLKTIFTHCNSSINTSVYLNVIHSESQLKILSLPQRNKTNGLNFTVIVERELEK